MGTLPPTTFTKHHYPLGAGPLGHLIRLLSPLEHLPSHLALSASGQGLSGLLAHLLQASGLQGSDYLPARMNCDPHPQVSRQISVFPRDTAETLL